jgi:23S rRNA pseudouridine1911/1915/1917 synthase
MPDRISVKHTITDLEGASVRVDRYIADTLKICTRSQLQARLGRLEINGTHAKPSRHVRDGDLIEVDLDPEPVSDLEPEEIPLKILFENGDVLVIDKPPGLVVHPGAGHRHGTLVHGLLHRYTDLDKEFEQHLRPGIVHRLDKDTSGVLIVAKNTDALGYLQKQFQSRETEKIYVAIVKGCPAQDSGIIQGPIRRDPVHRKKFAIDTERGKSAETEYTVIRRFNRWSLVSVRPLTGRTHQIRVHLKSLGTPVAGDPLYRRGALDSTLETRLMLHAFRLTLRLPGENRQRSFRSPLEQVMRKTLSILHARYSSDPG